MNKYYFHIFSSILVLRRNYKFLDIYKTHHFIYLAVRIRDIIVEYLLKGNCLSNNVQ